MKKESFLYVIPSNEKFGGYHIDLYTVVADYEHEYDIEEFAKLSEKNMLCLLTICDSLKEDIDTLRKEVSDLKINLHGYE